MQQQCFWQYQKFWSVHPFFQSMVHSIRQVDKQGKRNFSLCVSILCFILIKKLNHGMVFIEIPNVFAYQLALLLLLNLYKYTFLVHIPFKFDNLFPSNSAYKNLEIYLQYFLKIYLADTVMGERMALHKMPLPMDRALEPMEHNRYVRYKDEDFVIVELEFNF